MAQKRKREKSLIPSLREKKRYLLLGKVKKEEIEKAILDYIGILGYSKATPMWIKDNILAVNRKQVNEVKAALLLAEIEIKRISGTLKGLRKGK